MRIPSTNSVRAEKCDPVDKCEVHLGGYRAFTIDTFLNAGEAKPGDRPGTESTPVNL